MKKTILYVLTFTCLLNVAMSAEFYWQGEQGGTAWEMAGKDTANEVCSDLQERANSGSINEDLYTQNCRVVPDITIDRNLLLNMLSVSQDIEVSEAYRNGMLNSLGCFQDNGEEPLSARECSTNFLESISIAISTGSEESEYITQKIELTPVTDGSGSGSSGSDSDESANSGIDDGFYTVSNVYSGKELEVRNPPNGDVTEEQRDVQQWEAGDNPKDNQIWYVDQPEGGGYRFTNLASSLVLDITGGFKYSEANANQWFWNGNDWQRFKLEEVNKGEYNIVPLHNESNVLDLDSSEGKDDDGTTVFQYFRTGDANQRWTFNSVDNQISMSSIDPERPPEDDEGGDEEQDTSERISSDGGEEINWELKTKGNWYEKSDCSYNENANYGSGSYNCEKFDVKVRASLSEGRIIDETNNGKTTRLQMDIDPDFGGWQTTSDGECRGDDNACVVSQSHELRGENWQDEDYSVQARLQYCSRMGSNFQTEGDCIEWSTIGENEEWSYSDIKN